MSNILKKKTLHKNNADFRSLKIKLRYICLLITLLVKNSSLKYNVKVIRFRSCIFKDLLYKMQ